MLEYYLDVAMKSPAFALGLTQLEASGAFLAEIPPLWLVSEQKLGAIALALIHLKEGEDTVAANCWDLVEFDCTQALDGR